MSANGIDASCVQSMQLTQPSPMKHEELIQKHLYEIQHFGFTSKSFVNGVYNAIIEYLQEGLSYVQQFLSQEFDDVVSSDKVQEAIDGMIPYFVAKLERSFDVLERYLTKNVFCISPDVVLPEDKLQLNQSYTVDDETNLDGQITQLKDNILALKYANSKLREELTHIDIVQAKFEKALIQMEELKAINISNVIVQRSDMEEFVEIIKRLIQTVSEMEDVTPSKKQRIITST